MSKIIALQSRDNDGTYQIGAVEVDDKVGANAILFLWNEWQEEVEHPDSDSEFVDWLVDQHGFKRADIEIVTVG